LSRPFRRQGFDIEMQHIQTLSQKLVAKREFAHFKDYACNVYADKLALLDIIIIEEKDEEIKEMLEKVREQRKRLGEALWIMHADVLTNLGLKVGKTGEREISGAGTPENV